MDSSTNTMTPSVFIVDDDPAVRESLAMLIMAQGMRAVTFANAQEFVRDYREGDIGCMILDIRMPQMSGMALQELLKKGADRTIEARIKSLNVQLDDLAYTAFGISEEERHSIEEAVTR